MSGLDTGLLRDRIRFERAVRPAGKGKAGQETWQPIATVRAEILDKLPSRGEQLAEGMTMAARPARIRIRPRSDITSDMRIAVLGPLPDGETEAPVRRYMAIIAGPARVREPACTELMAQEYSTTGSGA